MCPLDMLALEIADSLDFDGFYADDLATERDVYADDPCGGAPSRY